MHTPSASIDNFSALQFGSDSRSQSGAIDLRALSQSVGEDPERFAREFMDSVAGTLDRLEVALAEGADHKFAELGSQLQTFSRMASALGLSALCEVLSCVQLRATSASIQACDIS